MKGKGKEGKRDRMEGKIWEGKIWRKKEGKRNGGG